MAIERRADCGGVLINYAEAVGGIAPLVLIHGGSARWQAVAALIPDLAARWHVFAPDLRGHGRSAWAPGRYRLQDYANDLSAFLQQVTGPAILVGHSLGGMAAVMAAGQRPDLVRALVVGDSPLTGETWRRVLQGQRALLETWRAIASAGHTEAELLHALREMPVVWGEYTTAVPARIALGEGSPWFADAAANLSQHDPDMLTSLIDRFEQTVAGYDPQVLLPAITCPTLLLQADPALAGLGMADTDVALALGLLPHATHLQLQGRDHGSVLQPEIIDSFLVQHGLGGE